MSMKVNYKNYFIFTAISDDIMYRFKEVVE